MNIRFLLCGILIALLWITDTVDSILLTTTLLTGFMGGFLIGRMSLGTFLGLLSTNGTGISLPSTPSVNLSSILTTLDAIIPREANGNPDSLPNNILASTISPHVLSANQAQYSLPVTASPNIPYIYTYSYPLTYSYSTSAPSIAPETSSPLKLSVIPIKPVDVPISLDDRVRDRFIRQLAIMDPLNCLPKIFCEVTADPYTATMSIEHGTITNVGPMGQPSVTQGEVVAYEYHLHRQREQTSTTTKPTTTSTTTTTIAPQNDEEADSQSASEEDDLSTESDSEEDDDSFEQYKKEQEHKLEMQALEEMVDETEDPETYMFILRDKKRRKTARKKYKDKHKKKALPLNTKTSLRHEDLIPDTEISPLGHSSMYDSPDYNEELPFLNRRMSPESPRPPPPMAPPMLFPPMMTRSTEAPMHDMFADDPFFDDFPTTSGRRTRSFEGRGYRRRAKRQVLTKEDLMKKYRVAFMVAEKYRSPDMCNKAFPSCPYRAKTILSVVNRLESGLMPFQLASDKKNYLSNENNIATFKNTLQAIERLNKATLEAQLRGEPVNIEKVTEVAASSTSKIDAYTSQNIVNEFQQAADKMKRAKLKGKKKHKRRKTVKNEAKYDAVHYYNKAQMAALTPKERIKPGASHEREVVRHHTQDDELQIQTKYRDVPSFKQTYKEMFKRSKVSKGQQRQYSRKQTTTVKTPTTVTSYLKTQPESKSKKKFSEEHEDDEEDAKDSEDAINASIGSRYRSPL